MPQLRAEQKLESSHDDQLTCRSFPNPSTNELHALQGLVRVANVKSEQANLTVYDMLLLHEPKLIWQG